MKTIERDELVDRVATWMRDVMVQRNWSAERWARRAGTSPTNITRLLNGQARHIPSMHTLAKLASVAGEPPPLMLGGKATTTRALPRVGARELKAVYETRSLTALAALEMRPSEVHVPVETPQSYAAVRVEADSMSASGIGEGDTVVVDVLAVPAHGNTVCTIFGGKIAPMIYAPPYLIPQSTNASWRPMPLDNAQIVGVCRQQLRTLA